MIDILIKNGMIIDGTGTPRRSADIGISAGRIAFVDQENGCSARTIINASGWYILPGFIDTHLHISLDPSNPKAFYDSSQNPLEIVVRTVGNAQAALRAGITTIGDCGAENKIIFSVRDAIRRGELMGPRILTSGSPLVPAGGHGAEIGRIAKGVGEVREAVRQQAEAGADFIKVMATAGGGEKPGESHYGIDELTAIREEAERNHLIVAAHAHGSQGISNCVEAGIPRIEHCTFFNGENGFDFNPIVAQAIAEKGIIVSPTNVIDFRRIQHGGIGAPRQELNQIWRSLLDHGVSFAASSDAGVTDMFFDDYALIPELLVSELGLAPMAALIACTRTAAVALGLSTEIGTLERGKIADLVAVKGNPLEDMTTLRNIELVMQSGNIVSLAKQIPQ